MSDSTSLQYSLTVNTDTAYSDIRKLETIIIRCLNYAERLTGDPNLKQGMQTIQRAIVLLRTLQQTIRLTQLALIPGAGLIAGALAATSAVGSGFAIYDTITGI